MQWDGRESVDSYLRTLRRCYAAYCARFEAVAATAGRSGKAARFRCGAIRNVWRPHQLALYDFDVQRQCAGSAAA